MADKKAQSPPANYWAQVQNWFGSHYNSVKTSVVSTYAKAKAKTVAGYNTVQTPVKTYTATASAFVSKYYV